MGLRSNILYKIYAVITLGKLIKPMWSLGSDFLTLVLCKIENI